KRRNGRGHSGHSRARATLASPESIIPASAVSLEYLDYGFRHSLGWAGMTLFCAPRKGKSLLRRRGGIEGGGIRLVGGRIEALDLCRFAQVVDKIGLRAACDVILQLTFDLIICRRRPDALVFDFDDVPAKLRLDRIRDLALIELESGFGEFRHHLILGEIAEVAAFGRAGVF